MIWFIIFSFGIVYVLGLSTSELSRLVAIPFVFYHLPQSSSHPSLFPSLADAVGLARVALAGFAAAALGAGELELERDTPMPPDW
jgi:hypothetical protein